MSKLQFRLAYRTDAAGKYNPTAPLEGNEDNMFVDANLSSPEHGSPLADNVIDLSEKGCLMVVADGMGGMNAGEVASDIAIRTVTEYFDNEHMKGKSFRDSRSRMNYMEDVVVAADAAIKADARVNLDHEGMGSTIIMAWLCDDEICLTWCGDSRAYLFRPGRGFWQVSKDHSYVQGLVDEGKITMDEAFDHPNGNIITRSLGDPEKKAKADSVHFDVYQGDIFMLCSDGLSGVLRDHKTYMDGQRIDTENLEDIIAAHRASMAECRDELFAAAERNDWYDNVTAILCEVVSGNAAPAVAPAAEPAPAQPVEHATYTPAPNPVQPNKMHSSRISIRKRNLPIIIAAAVVLLGIVGVLVWFLKPDNANDKSCQENPTIDTIAQASEKSANDSLTLANPIQSEPKIKKEEKKPEPKKEEKKQIKTSTDNAKETELDTSDGINLGIVKGGKTPANSLAQPDSVKSKSANEGNNANGKMLSELAEVTTGGSGLNVTGKTPEEQMFNEIVTKSKNGNLTIEDCKKYLRKYRKDGKDVNAEHWEFVAGKFRIEYLNQIKACTTVEEVDAILNKHDDLMKNLHLDGMAEYDKNPKKYAIGKKRELEKDIEEREKKEKKKKQEVSNNTPRLIPGVGDKNNDKPTPAH